MHLYLFLPPAGHNGTYLFPSFWQVQVTYTKSRFPRFRAVCWGRANTFSFLFLRSTPRVSLLSVSTNPALFRGATQLFLPFYPFFLVPPFTSRTSRRTSPLLGFLPTSFHVFSTALGRGVLIVMRACSRGKERVEEGEGGEGRWIEGGGRGGKK